MVFMIMNDLITNVRFIALCQDHLLKAQRKEVWTIIGNVMDPKIVDEEFMSFVKYIKYKLFERDNQKLETQWAKEHVKKMANYVHW